jgi:adiponectin receptor
MIPFFDRDSFAHYRFLVFFATALSSFAPLIHIQVKFIGTEFLNHFNFWPFYIGCLIYFIGGYCYARLFPECHFKGKLDYFGNSHNIMHICVVAGALIHYYGSIQNFHDRQLYSCPLPSKFGREPWNV